MYFPFFKPQSGGKRFAAQPQTIYSEFPYIYFRRKYHNCQLFIVNCQLKKAFVSHNKRQRHNFLCGTTLVPFFDNGTCVRCIGRTRWGLLPRNGGSAHCSEGISHGASCRLAPTGGSLKRGVPGLLSSSWHCICLPKGLICGWDRSSGRIAGSGWQTGWWWCRQWGAWVLPWGQCPPWNPPGPPRCGQSRRLRSRCHTA